MAFRKRRVLTRVETRVDGFVCAVARVNIFISAAALHVCEWTMLDSTTGSPDGRLEGLGKYIIRLDTRIRRLGTSGILLDTRLYQNFTDWAC